MKITGTKMMIIGLTILAMRMQIPNGSTVSLILLVAGVVGFWVGLFQKD